MTEFASWLLGCLVGALLALVFGTKAKTAAATWLGDMHKLVEAGILEKQHVVEYVETHLAGLRADAAMTTTRTQIDAQQLVAPVATDAKTAVAAVADVAAKVV